MSVNDRIYSTPEWFESLAWQHRWIEYFAGWWAGHWGKPKVVVDYGAGDGWWCHAFHEMGATDVYAIELYDIANEYIPDTVNVEIRDLRVPIGTYRTADLVICLEVAEHLEMKYARNLCKTLVGTTGNLLLFSAAPPGQEGTGHVNLQPPDFWIRMIERWSKVKFSEVRTNETRAAFDRIQNGLFEFLVRNLMVFARVE